MSTCLRPLSVAFVAILGLSNGCHETSNAAPDARPGDDASPDVDAATGSDAQVKDADVPADADLSTCQTEKLRYAFVDESFGPGDHCDQIQLCTSKDGAKAISELAPEFDCEEMACGDQEYSCLWLGPGTVDESEWAQLCSVSVLEDGPDEILCAVFLP